MTAPASPESPHRLGPMAASAVVAGCMLGIGIFLVPGVVAANVPSGVTFLAIWAFGGLVALAGAAAYAELGVLMPRAGGDYVFLREAFGSSVAVAGGWLLALGVFTGSIAAMAVGICEYQLPTLLAPLGLAVDSKAIWLSLGPLDVSAAQVLAVGVVVALTFVNLAGLRPAARTQILTTAVPVVAFAALGVAALASGVDAPTGTATEHRAELTAAGLATAFAAVYFAYSGWNAVIYIAGEVANPARNIPRSLIGGTLLVTALYLVLTAGFLSALGLAGLAASGEAGTATATTILGDQVELAVCAFITLALLGSLNATILGGSRIIYAMAVDGALPRRLGCFNRRSVPARALWLQAAVSLLLIASGTFERLISLTTLMMLLLGSLSVLALFVLRRRWPERERAHRALGYPWLPAGYVAVSIAMLGVSVWQALAPGQDRWERVYPLLGLGAFGLLLGAHLVWSRARRTG